MSQLKPPHSTCIPIYCHTTIHVNASRIPPVLVINHPLQVFVSQCCFSEASWFPSTDNPVNSAITPVCFSIWGSSSSSCDSCSSNNSGSRSSNKTISSVAIIVVVVVVVKAAVMVVHW